MVRELAERILARVRAVGGVWGSYTLELTLDALLDWSRVSGNLSGRDYVLFVLRERNESLDAVVPYEQRPFGHLGYNLYRCVGDPRIARAFVESTRRMREQVDRSPDGFILHRPSRGEPAILLDFMQDYIARMARAGALTGELSFHAEAVKQARLHRDLLCDPNMGLWRQGRGWDQENPDALAPGAWSRGQGWVLRGLADAVESMPPGNEGGDLLRIYLVDLLEDLLPHQDAAGFWHCLVDRPETESMQETSGTAMVAAALYRALKAGWVADSRFRIAADRAFEAVAGRVDPDGRVRGACVGPGPLHDHLLERYAKPVVTEDEPHGWFAVLGACAARIACDADESVTANSPTA